MKQKLKGSILMFSLMILTAMLAIATSLSVATIIEKKGASETQFSMQSLQTADSGVQLALKKINSNLIKDVVEIYSSCDLGVVKNLSDAGQGTYDLYFYAADSVTPVDCNSPANEIVNIKSVGTYKNTVRSVNVAVAASGNVQTACMYDIPSGATCLRIDTLTGKTECKNKLPFDASPFATCSANPWDGAVAGSYQLSCVVDRIGGTKMCFRLETLTGKATCKYKNRFTDASPWKDCPAPWSTATAGNYQFDCFNDGVAVLTCVRVDITTGKSACRYNQDIIGNALWKNCPAEPWL